MAVLEGDKNLSSSENKGENKVRGLSIKPSAVLFAFVKEILHNPNKGLFVWEGH